MIDKGNSIRFQSVHAGRVTIDTDWLIISQKNLFATSSIFVISVFDELFTLLIDGTMVLNIEQVIEEEGEFYMCWSSSSERVVQSKLDKLMVSSHTLSFEPILTMKKNADAYFMVANSFYEQNAYELALFYYKKAVSLGEGDFKIYNRLGNLQFLIENYPVLLLL